MRLQNDIRYSYRCNPQRNHVQLAAQTGDTSTVLGEVFTVSGNSVDILCKAGAARTGKTLYLLQDGKPVGKLQVTQTFHTKVKAKVIESSVTVVKGISVGRWKEGKKKK